jgi:hypothetical protein
MTTGPSKPDPTGVVKRPIRPKPKGHHWTQTLAKLMGTTPGRNQLIHHPIPRNAMSVNAWSAPRRFRRRNKWTRALGIQQQA